MKLNTCLLTMFLTIWTCCSYSVKPVNLVPNPISTVNHTTKQVSISASIGMTYQFIGGNYGSDFVDKKYNFDFQAKHNISPETVENITFNQTSSGTPMTLQMLPKNNISAHKTISAAGFTVTITDPGTNNVIHTINANRAFLETITPSKKLVVDITEKKLGDKYLYRICFSDNCVVAY